jgi:Caspase domain
MNLSELRISRRSVALAAAVAGMVSLAIGAHAALNMRALDAARTIASQQSTEAAGKKPSRIALVIGNGHYPDANAPLTQPINDARALTASLRRDGFDVDVVEDATRDDMGRAIERLRSKIRPDSVVMLFFGGYGVQVGRESYMIPVDAAIWKESDVRRDGLSIESVLDVMKEQGACAKLVVVDASRRNPYERRFRSFSHGLAPITAPDNALILTSATPGQVADDSAGQHSVLMSELLNNIDSARDAAAAEPGKETDKAAVAAETVFNKTRVAISRASEGAQVPSVSSSLLEDVRFGVTANAGG